MEKNGVWQARFVIMADEGVLLQCGDMCGDMMTML
jgi:hypothetical protein